MILTKTNTQAKKYQNGISYHLLLCFFVFFYNLNFIYPRYYFTIKIEYLQKKTTSDLPIGRAHANI